MVKVEWFEDLKIDDFEMIVYLKWCNLMSYVMLKRWVVGLFLDEKVCIEYVLGFILFCDSYMFLLLYGFFWLWWVMVVVLF